MTITGTVINVLEAEKVSDKLTKRCLWLETPHEKYPQTLSIEFVNDKCALLDNIGINDKVDIEVELRGRSYTSPKTGETKVYNTIAGWKVTVANQKAAAPAKKAPPVLKKEYFTDAVDDSIEELPF